MILKSEDNYIMINDFPDELYDRYERVAKILQCPIDDLFNAAILMGIARHYDQMTDDEVKALGKL